MDNETINFSISLLHEIGINMHAFLAPNLGLTAFTRMSRIHNTLIHNTLIQFKRDADSYIPTCSHTHVHTCTRVHNASPRSQSLSFWHTHTQRERERWYAQASNWAAYSRSGTQLLSEWKGISVYVCALWRRKRGGYHYFNTSVWGHRHLRRAPLVSWENTSLIPRSGGYTRRSAWIHMLT